MNQNLSEKAKGWYLQNIDILSKRLNGSSKNLLSELREKSKKKFLELDFPNRKNEEWRFTDVTPILKHNFIPSILIDKTKFTPEEIKKYLFTGFDFYLLTFINGIFEEDLSDLKNLPNGLIAGSLNKILKDKPELIHDNIDKFSVEQNIFNALNSIYAYDGFVIIADKNVVLDKPVQILFLNGNNENEVLASPKNLIIANNNSQLSVIVNYKGFGDKNYFMNSTVDVFIGESALIDYYKIQDENDDSFHIEKIYAVQNSKSIFNQFNISFGGSLVRNDINSKLDGEFTETHYYGLYLAQDNQHVSNYTFIDHAKPNCMSNELYKGILDDNSHGVFNGKIFVRPGAQKTNAYQQNKAILLSKDAKINTKPQLEIFADDVKCTHGAAVGHLDEEAEFYIRSRGVPQELAKSILIRAFAYDVIESMKIEELKEQINHRIFERLHRVEFQNNLS
ncbi:MAG: Fe-S cluster assembly protein SufD [Melioribacteraceae bacterium]